MAGTISQWQQGAFSTPVNGTVADATVVLSNDNATRTKHNSHDSDATIHVQSSTLAARPAASVAQRVWITTDGLRAYIDTGAAWNEVAYLSLAAGGTVSGPVVLSSTLSVAGLLSATAGVAASGATSTFAGASSSVNAISITSGILRISTAGTHAIIVDTADTTLQATTIQNGLAVSSGITAVQALTATTGSFSGDVLFSGGIRNNRATTSCLTGTFTTAFVLPAVDGAYLVITDITGSGAAYQSTSIVNCDGISVYTLTKLVTGVSTDVQMSGGNFQVKQNSGGTANVQTVAIRIA